jgi:ribulose-5-phosphate 4-epimerase/fuculose-1-phosphate aldolase
MDSEQGLRSEIVAVVEELYEHGMITPTGGNVSVRLLGEEDAYLVTPTMLYKGALKPDDIVKVNGKGRSIQRGKRPSVETSVHISVYHAFPDIEAVIHSHARLCTALGLIGGHIPPITVDAVAFTNTRIIPYCLSGSPELCDAVVSALDSSPAVLLQNHGLLTVGWTLRQAANRTLAIEEVAHILLACKLFGGKPTELPEEALELLRSIGAT